MHLARVGFQNGKKKGKFGGSINYCPNCGETDSISAWNAEKKEWKKIK